MANAGFLAAQLHDLRSRQAVVGVGQQPTHCCRWHTRLEGQQCARLQSSDPRTWATAVQRIRSIAWVRPTHGLPHIAVIEPTRQQQRRTTGIQGTADIAGVDAGPSLSSARPMTAIHGVELTLPTQSCRKHSCGRATAALSKRSLADQVEKSEPCDSGRSRVRPLTWTRSQPNDRNRKSRTVAADPTGHPTAEIDSREADIDG